MSTGTRLNSDFPGLCYHETAPTSAKLIWTNNIPIMGIVGWEHDPDEALVRTLAPKKEWLNLPPGSNNIDEFVTLSLPSYGRGDFILPNSPIVVDGVKFPVITRKGIGSARQPVKDNGEVYGALLNSDERNYTGGVATKFNFFADLEYTEIWSKLGLRVRQPLRLFRLDKIFMVSGSENPTKIAKKNKNSLSRCEQAVVAVWATRNPFTFEDAIQILTPIKNNNDLDYKASKIAADNLLQFQSQFLLLEDSTFPKKLSEILALGEGAGEFDWFNYLATGYGQQVMKKALSGLIHGEIHRQNLSLGIEFKDLADVSGLPSEFQNESKNYSKWSDVPDRLKREVAVENVLVLLTILDLKITYNLINQRPWDSNIDIVIDNFMQAMKEESSDIYPQIEKLMLFTVTKDHRSGGLYGISSLCFDEDNTKAQYPGSPGNPDALLMYIENHLSEKIDQSGYSSKQKAAEFVQLYCNKLNCFPEKLLDIITIYNNLPIVIPELKTKIRQIIKSANDITDNQENFQGELANNLYLFLKESLAGYQDSDVDGAIQFFMMQAFSFDELLALFGKTKEERNVIIDNLQINPQPINIEEIEAIIKSSN